MDVISTGLNSIKVATMKKKKVISLDYSSNLLQQVLQIFKENSYIQEFVAVKNGRFDNLNLELNDNIHNCGTIKPRYNVGKTDYDKWEQRYLPSRNIGMLIVSTSKGLMTHKKAKQEGLGGRLIAYVY